MKHNPGFLAIVTAAKARIRECSIDEVVQRLKRGERVRLVDVREDEEWRAPRGREKGEKAGSGHRTSLRVVEHAALLTRPNERQGEMRTGNFRLPGWATASGVQPRSGGAMEKPRSPG